MHAYQAAEGDPDSRQVNPPGSKFVHERRREPCNIVDCLSRAEAPRLPADLPDRAEPAAQAHVGRAKDIAADLDGQARDRRVRHLNDQGWAPAAAAGAWTARLLSSPAAPPASVVLLR